MHRNRAENFASEKQRKREKRTRKSPKRAKPGAFWVLEGMETDENGSNQMRKPSVRTKVNHKTMQHMQKENRQKPRVSAGFVAGAEGLGLGCRLGRFAAERHWRSLTPRHAPQAGLRAHLVAKSYCTLTKKSGTAEAIPDFFGRGRRTRTLGTRFWSGCGGSAPGSKRTMLLTDFSRQAQKSWCWFGAEKVADGILRNRNDIFTKHL